MVREILIWPDPRLKEKAAPVARFDAELKKLVDDMAETMYSADGVGLAAPQVGVLQRIIIIDVSPREEGGKLTAFINPEIVESDGEMIYKEGCLSIPGEYEDVKRFARVKVRYQDVDGRTQEIEAADSLLAVALQHEIDHLDGTLMVDKISTLKRELIKKRMKKIKLERERERADALRSPPAL